MTSNVRALALVLALAGAAPAASAQQPTAPSPDPRIGLRGGVFDAGEATWNMRVVSKTPPGREFIGQMNSDLAFTGKYVIQGNFNGFQVWDLSNPSQPTLARAFVCPGSQSDVSAYRNLLFVSGEDYGGRLDCGTQGVRERISHDRLRGVRIFDITDIQNPKYVGNVQTCRGSHTHSLLVDPKDRENVYIYISGSAPVRPAEELAGCSELDPSEDPSSALFRIEVIKVPLANPELAAIVSSPRIFSELAPPPTHGMSPADRDMLERARERGQFVIDMGGDPYVLPPSYINRMLDSIAKAAGRTAVTAADSTMLRDSLNVMMERLTEGAHGGEATGPTQCHDITLFPEAGLAGGACEGYGMLLDIRDPANPRRLAAVADSNFSYWHSATFNNDGTKVLFSDEWGGGAGAKCRPGDPEEWGADAIFSIEGNQLRFRSYYKLPAPQTPNENCVAHNGSLIPIPGRDVMVQAWYQGGISVFDWTDAANPREIAFFDRGPIDETRPSMAGSWSVYWYNGVIVSSEIARGLDILELTPSPFLSQNEIDAAKTITTDHVNTQGQQRFAWPPSFPLARAYVDQLERSQGLPAARITTLRNELAAAERATGGARRDAVNRLATQLDREAAGSSDAAKVRLLAAAARDLGR
jgi:hypothetical protein